MNKFLKLISILLIFELIECKRNYKHSKQELELTKVVVIRQPKCNKTQVPIIIHSAAHTSGKYFDRRQLSRNTWVKEAKAAHFRPLFVIGLPNDDQTQEELLREANEHNDMIQFGFIDDYYNLTLKALSVLRWLSNNCLTSDYVLKTDDDVLVNIPKLKQMFADLEFGNGLTGKMLLTKSNRRFGHKWFMPHNVYPHNFYQFLYGFSYVMSKSSIKKLYRSAANFTGPVVDIDDLFMTGELAQKARVRLFYDRRFEYYCGTNACRLNHMIVIHGCDSVNQTHQMWNLFKNTSTQDCDNNSRFQFDFSNIRLTINFDSD